MKFILTLSIFMISQISYGIDQNELKKLIVANKADIISIVPEIELKIKNLESEISKLKQLKEKVKSQVFSLVQEELDELIKGLPMPDGVQIKINTKKNNVTEIQIISKSNSEIFSAEINKNQVFLEKSELHNDRSLMTISGFSANRSGGNDEVISILFDEDNNFKELIINPRSYSIEYISVTPNSLKIKQWL